MRYARCTPLVAFDCANALLTRQLARELLHAAVSTTAALRTCLTSKAQHLQLHRRSLKAAPEFRIQLAVAERYFLSGVMMSCAWQQALQASRDTHARTQAACSMPQHVPGNALHPLLKHRPQQGRLCQDHLSPCIDLPTQHLLDSESFACASGM